MEDGLATSELRIEIDWVAHNNFMASGLAVIYIDDWGGEVSIELDEAIIMFNEYIQENGCSTRWAVRYNRRFSADEIDDALGFRDASPIQWADGTIEEDAGASPIELPEVRSKWRILRRR
jgi:hypothetical protein